MSRKIEGNIHHLYLAQLQEESWLFRDGEAELTDLRLETGAARGWQREGEWRIEATSDPEAISQAGPPRSLSRRPRAAGGSLSLIDMIRVADELAIGEDDLHWLQESVAVAPPVAGLALPVRIQVVRRRRIIVTSGSKHRDGAAWAVCRLLSSWPAPPLVVPLERLAETLPSLSPLREGGGSVSTADDLPLHFAGGTSAVLMHEAAGHAAEYGEPLLDWPAGLEVRDEPQQPGLGALQIDDTGQATSGSDLLRGGRPSAWRRAGFRDVPLPRMTNVVVRNEGKVAPLPGRRIEIASIGRGDFDPSRGEVSFDEVMADMIRDGERVALAPFRLVIDRQALPSALTAGGAAVTEYPGVICSSEGQRLPVGSFGCDLIVARSAVRLTR